MPIVAYSRISLTVNTPTGTKQLNISEVTYIPDWKTRVFGMTLNINACIEKARPSLNAFAMAGITCSKTI